MSEKELSFEIGDFVQLSHEGDLMFYVSGVINDSERLFVYGSTGEIEVSFDRVDKQFKEVSSSPSAPDPKALLKRCKPWLELDLERRKFTDYDDSENKAYGDKAISELNALLSDIAKAEEEK